MVVKVDSVNYEQYRIFFSDAYKYLEELEIKEGRTILHDEDINEEKTFTSVAQYFKYIEEFKDCDKKDFFLLKLPLDEGLLEIDANSRVINVPASFSKNSIMQKDKIAETLVFTIDRFIDNIDLCNVSSIYVQWTAPDGKGGIREWATPIELIDRDSIPNKIKFGWTIDEIVTLYPGKVSFAVTFFISDEDQDNKVAYRLTTLSQSFEVKPVLQPEINSNTTINRPSNALNRVIRNNNYPGQGIKNPLTPEFISPGLDLPSEETLIGEGEGTLTLKAQALVSDEGIISYDWYYVPYGGVYKYRCGIKDYDDNDNKLYYSINFEKEVEKDAGRESNILKAADYNMLIQESKNLFVKISEDSTDFKLIPSEQEKDGDLIEIFYDSIGTVSTSYEEILDENKMNAKDRFYVSINGNYEPYNKENEEHKEKTKYEKYTKFTVPPTGNVIGKYFVSAKNSIYPNTSSAQSSTECYLYGPNDISFTENGDLEETTFIETERTYHIGEKISVEEFELIANDEIKDKLIPYDSNGTVITTPTEETIVDHYQPKESGIKIIFNKVNLTLDLDSFGTFNYAWQGTKTEGDWTDSVLENETSNSITVFEPGWYKAEISTKKNRQQKTKNSSTCRAVFNPITPTLSVVEYDSTKPTSTTAEGEWQNRNEENEYFNIDASPNSLILLVVDGDIITEEITKDENDEIVSTPVSQKNSKLYTDGIQYEWRIFNYGAGEYEVLNSETHRSLIPTTHNSFNDQQINNFSNHPNKISVYFTAASQDSDYYNEDREMRIGCFAVNSLANKQSDCDAITFRIG